MPTCLQGSHSIFLGIKKKKENPEFNLVFGGAWQLFGIQSSKKKKISPTIWKASAIFFPPLVNDLFQVKPTHFSFLPSIFCAHLPLFFRLTICGGLKSGEGSLGEVTRWKSEEMKFGSWKNAKISKLFFFISRKLESIFGRVKDYLSWLIDA